MLIVAKRGFRDLFLVRTSRDLAGSEIQPQYKIIYCQRDTHSDPFDQPLHILAYAEVRHITANVLDSILDHVRITRSRDMMITSPGHST